MMMTIVPGNEGVSGFVSNEGDQITEENIQSYIAIGLQYRISKITSKYNGFETEKYIYGGITTSKLLLNKPFKA